MKTTKEHFKNDLLNIAKTTLSSKILNVEKEHFAKICVDAVLRLKVRFYFKLIIFIYLFINFILEYLFCIKQKNRN